MFIYEFHLYMIPELANPQIQKVCQSLLGNGVRREWGVTANVYEVSFWGSENISGLDSGGNFIVCEYTNKH